MRDLGPRGFITFQLIVGGNALAALVHPLFIAPLIYSAASGAPMWRDDSVPIAVLATVYGASLVIGYFTSASSSHCRSNCSWANRCRVICTSACS